MRSLSPLPEVPEKTDTSEIPERWNYDQDKVNHAKDDLEKAISQLEEKPGKPENGTSGNKAQSAVKTGDSAPIAVWLLAVLLSAVSMGTMYRMKRKK